MLSIGVIGTDLNPPLNEGIKNTVHEIYRRMARKGIEVLLITKGWSREEQSTCLNDMESTEYGGLKICSIPVVKHRSAYSHLTGAPSFITVLPLYLKSIYARLPIDIFHIHTSFATLNSLIAFQIKSLFEFKDSRIVVTQYSSTFSPYVFGEFDLKSLIVPLLSSHVSLEYAPADLIITLSKRVRNALKRHFAKRVIWFPHIAIDTEKFKPDKKCRNKIRDELSIDDETIVLLYAGDLTPTRGIEFFIDVIRYAIRSYRYPIKGLIPLKDINTRLDKYNYIMGLLRSNGIDRHVEILGYREDINCVINSSDIVLMPLRKNYGFMDLPRFLLEAMSCGKPVVTTTVGAIAESLNSWINSVLCKPDDLKCFILTVRNLIENHTLRNEIGMNARRTIMEVYNAEKVSDRLYRIYNMLLM
ncbi:MAG: glycosyltransferase family 4 protein [Thermosphaera sp.]